MSTRTPRTRGPGHTGISEEGCANLRSQRQNQARRSLRQELKAREQSTRELDTDWQDVLGDHQDLYLQSRFSLSMLLARLPQLSLLLTYWRVTYCPVPTPEATSSSSKGQKVAGNRCMNSPTVPAVLVVACPPPGTANPCRC